VRLAYRGAYHAIRTIDHAVAAAVQAKQNDRGSGLSRARREDLVCLPMEHGPTYRDASTAQFATPFFAALLMKFSWHTLVCGIHGLDKLQMRSQLNGKMASKTKNS